MSTDEAILLVLSTAADSARDFAWGQCSGDHGSVS